MELSDNIKDEFVFWVKKPIDFIIKLFFCEARRYFVECQHFHAYRKLEVVYDTIRVEVDFSSCKTGSVNSHLCSVSFYDTLSPVLIDVYEILGLQIPLEIASSHDDSRHADDESYLSFYLEPSNTEIVKSTTMNVDLKADVM